MEGQDIKWGGESRCASVKTFKDDSIADCAFYRTAGS